MSCQPMLKYFVVARILGFVQCLVASPLELAKIRVQVVEIFEFTRFRF
jgi:hypothetical protein